MQVADVLDAVKVRLETIDGLTVTTDPNAAVVVPMAVVTDGEIEYHSTFARGYDAITLLIEVFVATADSASGLSEAREYKSGSGSKSIRGALETAVGTELSTSSIVAVSGTVTTTEADGDGLYLKLTVEATAQIPGTA